MNPDPDPDLVVEALEHIRDNGSGATWDTEHAQDLARSVLPHAEAIAEMWADLQEPRNMTLAEWKNVQELITAARDLFPPNAKIWDSPRMERIVAALKNLEGTP